MIKVYIPNYNASTSEGIRKLQNVINEYQEDMSEQLAYSLEEAYRDIDTDLCDLEEQLADYEEQENANDELEEIKEILNEYKEAKTVEELKEIIERALF